LQFSPSRPAYSLAGYNSGQARGSRPVGEILYTDTARIEATEPLVSHTYQLIGKPDYVVRTAAGLVPVEVKSRPCGERGPSEGEVAQVVAYCACSWKM